MPCGNYTYSTDAEELKRPSNGTLDLTTEPEKSWRWMSSAENSS